MKWNKKKNERNLINIIIYRYHISIVLLSNPQFIRRISYSINNIIIIIIIVFKGIWTQKRWEREREREIAKGWGWLIVGEDYSNNGIETDYQRSTLVHLRRFTKKIHHIYLGSLRNRNLNNHEKNHMILPKNINWIPKKRSTISRKRYSSPKYQRFSVRSFFKYTDNLQISNNLKYLISYRGQSAGPFQNYTTRFFSICSEPQENVKLPLEIFTIVKAERLETSIHIQLVLEKIYWTGDPEDPIGFVTMKKRLYK